MLCISVNREQCTSNISTHEPTCTRFVGKIYGVYVEVYPPKQQQKLASHRHQSLNYCRRGSPQSVAILSDV